MTTRIYRASLLALAVLAVGALGALAHTMVIEPPESHHPYQRWMNEMLVPGPPATSLTVVETPEPCEIEEAGGCEEERVIQIESFPWTENAKGIFYHEIGHIWDEESMLEGQRLHFEELIHRTGLGWREESASPSGISIGQTASAEWFADSFALCARLPHIPVGRGYGYNVAVGIMGAKQLRATCRMIGRNTF